MTKAALPRIRLTLHVHTSVLLKAVQSSALMCVGHLFFQEKGTSLAVMCSGIRYLTAFPEDFIHSASSELQKSAFL